MKYGSYKRKIQKAADLLRAAFDHIRLIAICTGVIVTALITMLIIVGLVKNEQNIPDSVRYGDPVLYSADGILSPLTLEYGISTEDEQTEWSETAPIMPGHYVVRTVTKGLFGNKRYVKTHDFWITPREILVVPGEDAVLWGEEPSVTVDTAYGDVLKSYVIKWDSYSEETTDLYVDPASFVIVNDRGEDVTYAYKPMMQKRKTRIIPRDLTITVKKLTYTYDGTVHKGYNIINTPADGTEVPVYDYYDITSGGLVGDDYLYTDFDVGITDVGEVEHKPAFRVFGMRSDVTVHYNITVEPGSLTVTKRPLTIETESSERVYDGEPVTYRGFTVSGDMQPAEGQHIEADFITLTDAGSAENVPVFRIVDDDGIDRTDNYAVFIIPGRLTVTPRPVVIETEGGTWTYDAQTHSLPLNTINGLAAGHELKECPIPDVTDVGRIDNTREIVIFNADGQDVTGNYEITTIFGTLEVTPRPCTVTTPDAEWVYDGQIHEEPAVTVTGLLDSHTLQTDEAPQIQNVGQTENARSIIILDAEGRDVTGNYDITTQFGTLTVTGRPLSVTTESGSWVYDAVEHTLPDITAEGLVDGHTLQADEAVSILNVGTAENKRTITVVDADGRNVFDNYILTVHFGMLEILPRPLSLSTDSGSWVYDGEYHRIDGLRSLDGLIEGHSVDTGDAPALRDVGSIINSRDTRIVDEAGNEVTGNYEITTDFGTLTVTSRPLDIRMNSRSWVYDGYTHSDSGYTLGGKTSVAPGQGIILTNVPSIFHAGTVSNAPDYQVMDDEGRDVSSNYEISFTPGVLTVTKRTIRFSTLSNTWIYDGGTHVTDGFNIQSSLWLADTDTIIGEFTGFCDAGVYENALSDGWYIRNTEADQDVTEDYTITLKWGKITIKKRSVIVTSLSESRFYDGTVLYRPGCEAADGYGWADGDAPDEGEYPSITDAGKVINQPDSFRVVRHRGEADERDVTDNYALTFKWGSLEVKRLPVTLWAADAEKIYDGLPLSTKVEVTEQSPNKIVVGETLHAICNDTLTDAGTKVCKVDPAVKVTKADGSDSTGNYQFTMMNGKLTVLRRPVIIESGSSEKLYDGLPLTNKTCMVGKESLYNLVEGHTVTATITGSQTKVGSSDNTINASTVRIRDKNNVDVTRNYEIIKVSAGKLRVWSDITITVNTGSASKEYDGTPLTNNEYAVDTSKPISGTYTVLVVTTGIIIDPGKTDNTADVKVIDKNGKDVTDDFRITVVPGELLVTGNTSLAQGEIDKVYGKVKATTTGTMYLRMASYGDYTGMGWNGIVPYPETLPDNVSYNIMTSIALRNEGSYPVETAVFSDMLAFMVPTYFEKADGCYVPNNDVMYSEALTDYTVAYYDAFDLKRWNSLQHKLGEYTPYESEYHQYVYKTYTYVDRETAEWLHDNVIAVKGFDQSDPNIINQVATYVSGSAKYNLKYNTMLDHSSNAVIDFLSVYKEGVCRHFATATTLILRTLGIPARYVEGFAVDVVRNQETEIHSPGHAWCEAYIDGLGWVIVESTPGSGVSGGSEVSEPIEIEITPEFDSKVYDGYPLKPSGNVTYNDNLKELIAHGYTFTAEVHGEQTSVGDGVSKIVSFHLYDPLGNDVTESERFNITKKDGILRVVRGDIQIFPYQISKYYDGTNLQFEEEDFDVLTCPDGMEVFITPAEGKREACRMTITDMNTEIGSVIRWMLILNGQDVSDMYMPIIAVPDGMDAGSYVPYEILPCEIELSSESVTKVYDGKELTASRVWISKGRLAPGDTLYASASGRITDEGDTYNTILEGLIMILNKDGEDVTSSYNIKLNEGILKVLPSN